MASFRERQAQKKRPSVSTKSCEAERPKLIARAITDPFRQHRKDRTPVDEQQLLRSLGIAQDKPPRMLGQTTPDIPFTHLSEKDSERTRRFKTALLAEETQLGIYLDRKNETTETAWICVRVPEQEELLLLHELPLMTTFIPTSELEHITPSTPTQQTNFNSSADSQETTDPSASISSKPNTSVPF